MTSLCSLESRHASLGALLVGPVMLVRVYRIALKMVKNTRDAGGVTFYCHMQFTMETAAHAEASGITRAFEQLGPLTSAPSPGRGL